MHKTLRIAFLSVSSALLASCVVLPMNNVASSSDLKKAHKITLPYQPDAQHAILYINHFGKGWGVLGVGGAGMLSEETGFTASISSMGHAQASFKVRAPATTCLKLDPGTYTITFKANNKKATPNVLKTSFVAKPDSTVFLGLKSAGSLSAVHLSLEKQSEAAGKYYASRAAGEQFEPRIGCPSISGLAQPFSNKLEQRLHIRVTNYSKKDTYHVAFASQGNSEAILPGESVTHAYPLQAFTNANRAKPPVSGGAFSITKPGDETLDYTLKTRFGNVWETYSTEFTSPRMYDSNDYVTKRPFCTYSTKSQQDEITRVDLYCNLSVAK